MSRTCSHCGNSLEPQAQFCSQCGTPAAGGRAEKHEQSGRHFKRDALIIVGLVVAVVGVYFFMREAPPEPRHASSPNGNPGHDEMSQVLADLPDDYNMLVQMGNQTMDEQNFPLAAEIYRRALAIDGSSPDVRTDFGACLHAMGLTDRALEEFRTVMTNDSEHSISRFNMGVVFKGLGNNDSARYYWELYLEMDPDGTPAEATREFLSELGT